MRIRTSARRVQIGLVVGIWAVSLPEARGQRSTATIVISAPDVAELDSPKFPLTLRHSGGQSTVARPNAAREARFAVPAHPNELLRIDAVDGWPRLARTWVPRRPGQTTVLEPDPCCGVAFEDPGYRQASSMRCPRNSRGGPCTDADDCDCPPATESVWYTPETPCGCVIAPQLRVLAVNLSRPVKVIVNPEVNLTIAELTAVIGAVDRAATPYRSVNRGRDSLWRVRVVALEDEQDEAQGEYFAIAPETGWRYTATVTAGSLSRVTRDERIVLRGRR